LRRLEQALDAGDVQAEHDIALTHRIRFRDRRHWRRLVGSSEHFTRLRLTYVRLARLLQQADVAARLEAVSNRLDL
jgi:hypothetical protein